jgi:catalase (peroxidase I)
MSKTVDVNALKSEIRNALINQKANACPIAIRLAWHASGTYQESDDTGGSDGATMRFTPESTDEANAGLGIVRDLLLPIKKAHPEVSYADLWVLSGHVAIEFLGGPNVPFRLGRTDAQDGSVCPANGRLPDAAQGAQHLRDVFHRMGFNDKDIVCLSGAHTLGRCHKTRSGFDGPWTTNPLQFDNNYFRLLINMDWQKRQWDGPEQYEDKQTKRLMMLPTDMALLTDPIFKQHVEKYANDEELFFDDFSDVFARLTSLGCPFGNEDVVKKKELNEMEQNTKDFREYAMHGSVDRMRDIYKTGAVDPFALELTSRRSALHKAAFWGHILTINFLIYDVHMDLNQQDFNGDTAMHDAARFGHVDVVEALLLGGGNPKVKNFKDLNVIELALKQDKYDVAQMILKHQGSKL